MNRRDALKTGAAGAVSLLVGSKSVFPAEVPSPVPAMKIILWCWDARMTWDDQPGAISQRMAVSTQAFPYPKRPEAFLAGFKRLVDYAAKLGVRGLIVWGFLRDSHGGVAAARELCLYAADRDVAILPGVGLCSYGGFYFDGDHRFSLSSYLRAHPDRAYIIPSNKAGGAESGPVLDPSLKANQQWWREGVEWMLETFRVGGIDFEMGDFLVNPSAQAQAARAALGIDADENIQDVVVATRDLIPHAVRAMPGGIFINSTYRGYHQIKGFPKMPYVAALPKETVWQYTLTHSVKRPEYPDGFRGAPDHRRYGLLHWFNSSTRSMDKDYVPEIAKAFAGAHTLGFEYIGTYGEVSAKENAVADRNYRAQVAWALNPRLRTVDF